LTWIALQGNKSINITNDMKHLHLNIHYQICHPDEILPAEITTGITDGIAMTT